MIEGIMIFIIVLATSIGTYAIRRNAAKKDLENVEADRDARERYDDMCGEGETLRVVCRGWKKGEYYVLTSARLIIDNGLVTSIPLENVKKVRLIDAAGGGTKRTADAAAISVKADRKYKLYRASNEFERLVESLLAETAS